MAEATADPDFTPIITIDILVQAGRYPIDLKQGHLENALSVHVFFYYSSSSLPSSASPSPSSSSSPPSSPSSFLSGNHHHHHHHHHHPRRRRRHQATLIIVITKGITIISSLVSQRQVTAHASRKLRIQESRQFRKSKK